MGYNSYSIYSSGGGEGGGFWEGRRGWLAEPLEALIRTDGLDLGGFSVKIARIVIASGSKKPTEISI